MSMMVAHLFAARESLQPLWRAQAFVWARLAAFNCDAAGFRWTIVALAVRSLGAASALAQRQLGRWARSVLRRAWQGARFAAELRAADTMVAAGGR
jgi:hypothetical protein